MTLTTRLVAYLGTLLLAASALATLWGVALVGWTLWAGPTAARVLAAMVAFGLAVGSGPRARSCRATWICRSDFGVDRTGARRRSSLRRST